MAIVNAESKEIVLTLAYVGQPGAGKRTLLRFIHTHLHPDSKASPLLEETVGGTKVLSFNYLPWQGARIGGFNHRLQLRACDIDPDDLNANEHLYTLLKEADGLGLIVDSEPDCFAANINCLQILLDKLKGLDIGLTNGNAEYASKLEGLTGPGDIQVSVKKLPWVLVYNKRDLTNKVPLTDLAQALKVQDVRDFEAIFAQGPGAYSQLKTLEHFAINGILGRKARQQDLTGPNAGGIGIERKVEDDISDDDSYINYLSQTLQERAQVRLWAWYAASLLVGILSLNHFNISFESPRLNGIASLTAFCMPFVLLCLAVIGGGPKLKMAAIGIGGSLLFACPILWWILPDIVNPIFSNVDDTATLEHAEQIGSVRMCCYRHNGLLVTTRSNFWIVEERQIIPGVKFSKLIKVIPVEK